MSYNQPKLSPSTTWNPNAITFADNSSVGTLPIGLFVNINNTVYVAERTLNQVQVWAEGNMSPVRQVSGGLISPIAIFVTSSGDLCVDNGNANGRVDMWMPGSNDSFTVMYVDSTCFSLFMDIYQNIYCSLGYQHRVMRKSSNDVANISVSVAGNGTNGSASDLLSSPRGIFVDTQLNLYVADCGNHRVQFFVHGQLTATTVLGNGSVSTIVLDCPQVTRRKRRGPSTERDDVENQVPI